jgi:Phosphotransferase enzyme family
MTPELDVESSDERFREWMRGNLDRAAGHFGLTVCGQPVFGWRLRSIGARVAGADGQRWLRVASDYPEWASGDGWVGNADANVLAMQAKPQVLDVLEWEAGRAQRAELMTLLPGRAVSATDVLRQAVDLPQSWWEQLRRAIEELRVTGTQRVSTDQELVTRRAGDAFGEDLRIERWETVHGDLHWANLLAPDLGILDWELWGRGPVGTDAATLLCHSLLVPAVASQVRATFADILDAPAGRTAQLAVAARMLARVEGGDYPDLEGPLRRHAAALDGPATDQGLGPT